MFIETIVYKQMKIKSISAPLGSTRRKKKGKIY